MIFCDQLLFLHVPKTGGMSVTKYLLKVLPRPVYYTSLESDPEFTEPGAIYLPGIRHENLADAREIVAQYGYALEKFPVILAVLRNPYDIEVSRFSYLQKGHSWDRGHNQELALFEDFETFARESHDHSGTQRPLDSFFLIEGHTPKNLHVIFTEDLDAGFDSVLRHIGIEKKEPLLRENTSEREGLEKYYTAAAEEAVYQRYRWAFDAGYYSRLDAQHFTFLKESPSMASMPLLPLFGPVKQAGPAVGIWHDGWLGSELRFRFTSREPLAAFSITGHFPHEFAEGVELTLALNDVAVSTLNHRGEEFFWTGQLPQPIQGRITATISFSKTFCPNEDQPCGDNRQLSGMIDRIEWTACTANATPDATTSANSKSLAARPAEEFGRCANLSQLVWRPDRMTWGNLVFRIEQKKNDQWELGNQCFDFYKGKGLVDMYERSLARRPEFMPHNVMELGIWDGGSIAFWFEWFRPDKHVALDIKTRTDSGYFEQYVDSRNLIDRISTYWNTSQADVAALRQIVEHEFTGPLDLVIDDASHLYGPSKTSFETLFPLLRPGGLYLFEDWSWGHWPEYQRAEHAWANENPPTSLVFDLIECCGTRNSPIRSVEVQPGFVIIERNHQAPSSLADFTLDKFTSRHAKLLRPQL